MNYFDYCNHNPNQQIIFADPSVTPEQFARHLSNLTADHEIRTALPRQTYFDARRAIDSPWTRKITSLMLGTIAAVVVVGTIQMAFMDQLKVTCEGIVSPGVRELCDRQANFLKIMGGTSSHACPLDIPEMSKEQYFQVLQEVALTHPVSLGLAFTATVGAFTSCVNSWLVRRLESSQHLFKERLSLQFETGLSWLMERHEKALESCDQQSLEDSRNIATGWQRNLVPIRMELLGLNRVGVLGKSDCEVIVRVLNLGSAAILQSRGFAGGQGEG